MRRESTLGCARDRLSLLPVLLKFEGLSVSLLRARLALHSFASSSICGGLRGIPPRTQVGRGAAGSASIPPSMLACCVLSRICWFFDLAQPRCVHLPDLPSFPSHPFAVLPELSTRPPQNFQSLGSARGAALAQRGGQSPQAYARMRALGVDVAGFLHGKSS